MGKVTISGKGLSSLISSLSYQWQTQVYDIQTCDVCNDLADVLVLRYKFSRALEFQSDYYCLCRECYGMWKKGEL